MAYENKNAIESCIKKVHEQQGTTEKIQPIINELETTYCKAKAFDEVKEFVDKKIKEEEEKPRILLDDYDYGLNQAYNNVDDIILEFMESADDEK